MFAVVFPALLAAWADEPVHWRYADEGMVSEPRFATDVVAVQPPATRDEGPAAAPALGYLWAPGYWNWDGRQYLWVRGRWIFPREGYRWQPDSWIPSGSGWRLRTGYWARI